MTDWDQTVVYPTNGDHGHPARMPVFSEFTLAEEQPANVATGLVSLGFIWAAIKRGARLWGALAVIGLIIGAGYDVVSPPSQSATTSVLLTYGPDENPASAVFDNQAIAESHTVAQLAMRRLGDTQQSLGSFAGSYSAAVITDRVIQITASAPTASQAVANANAIAAAFLQFRAKREEADNRVLLQSLQQELSQTRGELVKLTSQISQVRAQPASAAQRARLKNLQDARTQADTLLGTLEGTIAATQAGTSTISAVTGSVVLDPASPLVKSKAKALLEYGAYGVIAGLGLGLGIVIVAAVVSDRLRRRDDIARALGVPVRLSVGPVRLKHRLPPGRRGMEAAGDPQMRRIVAHLRAAVPAHERPAALIVVAVDDPGVAALSLASLALSFAKDGRKVVIADLAAGAPAAAILGDKAPDAHVISVGQSQLTLAVPGTDEVAPIGPITATPGARERTKFTSDVASACARADVLLTLATLDPGIGGDHLATWGGHAIAIVTAGRASWVKVQAAGEMLRLAGITVMSAVLVGADKSDESLGLVPDSDAPASIDSLR